MRKKIAAILYSRLLTLPAATAAIFGMCVAGMAVAGPQGSLGLTSTSDTEITLTIPNFMQISEVSDLNLGKFDGTNSLSADDDVCIFRYVNASAEIDYTITATSGTGSFELAGNNVNNTDTVAFTASWDDKNGMSTALTHAAASAMFSSAFKGATCFGGSDSNAKIQVDVSAVEMSSKAADTYSATLNLLITPQ